MERVQAVALVLSGGLGNQLFQLSAAYVVSKKHPIHLLHNPRSNPHNRFGHDYNTTIFKYLIKDFKAIYNLFGYTLPPTPYSRCYLPYSPDDIKAGTAMMDYYQYYPPMQPYENEIRELVLKGLHMNPLPALGAKAPVFMHIRRGDYVGKAHMHFLQPIEYYQKAYSIISEKVEVDALYIVSDDIEWVKSQSFFLSLPNKIFWEEPDELKTLALLSLCVGGAICANSTFSWWGAFLGAHAARQPVVMPKHYFIDAPVNLFPSEWIVI